MKKSITDIPLKGRRVIMQVENISLKLVVEKLKELLGKPVKFLSDCVGPEVEEAYPRSSREKSPCMRA